MPRVVAVLAAASLLSLAGAALHAEPARIGDGQALLRRGIQLYREASYAESAAALEQARTRGDLDSEQSIECAFYLGAGYVALNSATAARRELRRVLVAQPEYEPPPYTSPKVAALLHDVKSELERQPRLRPLPPERHVHEGGFWVRFEASRTGGRAYGVVKWRWHGERDYHEAPLVAVGELLEAELPVAAQEWHEGTLEYYAEGLAPAGVLAAASKERPLELPVSAQLAAALRAEVDRCRAARN